MHQERWGGIKSHWLNMFRNREVHAGESVLWRVGANDEWCAEAYMETDYDLITPEVFEQVVKNYAVFKMTRGSGKK